MGAVILSDGWFGGLLSSSSSIITATSSSGEGGRNATRSRQARAVKTSCRRRRRVYRWMANVYVSKSEKNLRGEKASRLVHVLTSKIQTKKGPGGGKKGIKV